MGWVEGALLGVRDNNSKRPVAIFMNTVAPASSWVPRYMQPNYWHTLDLTNDPWLVPLDAKAIFLSGIMIISHGTDQGTADTWATFRAPGDDLPHDSYQIQAIEADVSAGQRSTCALWVPVKEGKVEFYWHHNQTSSYPQGSAVGMNLSLQAYIR